MTNSSFIKLFTLLLTTIIINYNFNQYFLIITNGFDNNHNEIQHDESTPCGHNSLNSHGYYYINKENNNQCNYKNHDGIQHDESTHCGHTSLNSHGDYYINKENNNQCNYKNHDGIQHDGTTPCSHSSPNYIGGYCIDD
ncbi:uncharacterized protein cubi_02129 [Cryptosporidium ubiquitum]|uniref:Uncharacterized protein n=1 Tax=Cryptosporidium ubiquitum TaxID=857276 RepID=A0A1J4MDD6_9CRYT|nr:uncharacterized protein cubi_02129 [Cryptosporidium ubiquitum]OII71991.1 hypothetical protein cubi_02129 [Cryptosporidium ubiquitum]